MHGDLGRSWEKICIEGFSNIYDPRLNTNYKVLKKFGSSPAVSNFLSNLREGTRAPHLSELSVSPSY